MVKRRKRLPKATPLTTTSSSHQSSNIENNESLHQENESPKPVKIQESLPPICEYKTSYADEFVRKERGKQTTPFAHSPTRKNRPHAIKFKIPPLPRSPHRNNRPHPIKLEYLQGLGKSSDFTNHLASPRINPLVCKVHTKQSTEECETMASVFKSLSFGNAGCQFPKTTFQEFYGLPSIQPLPASGERTLLLKKNASPARGILPSIQQRDAGAAASDEKEAMLPGCTVLTTAMWVRGPHHYVPRKRKHVVVSRTAAAGVTGKRGTEYRYYNTVKC